MQLHCISNLYYATVVRFMFMMYHIVLRLNYSLYSFVHGKTTYVTYVCLSIVQIFITILYYVTCVSEFMFMLYFSLAWCCCSLMCCFIVHMYVKWSYNVVNDIVVFESFVILYSTFVYVIHIFNMWIQEHTNKFMIF